MKRKEDLLEALANLGLDQRVNTGSEDRVAGLLAQLSPKIARQERTADDEPSSSEAHDLIEIMGNLLVSILEDKALPENARIWITRLWPFLTADLLKMAKVEFRSCWKTLRTA